MILSNCTILQDKDGFAIGQKFYLLIFKSERSVKSQKARPG